MQKEIIPKMLFVSLTNHSGGAEQVMLMLAKATDSKLLFLKKNVRTPLNSEEIKAELITNRSLIFGFLFLLPALWSYRSNYIIVSSHAYLNAYLCILKRTGILKSKIVVRESTSIFSRFTGLKRLSYKVFYRIGYPYASLIICQSELMQRQLLASNSYINPERVVTIANPVDLPSVYIKAQSQLSLDICGEFVCAAGRLIAIKGFDILITAFNEISQIYPKLKLIILGDGPEREKLSSLIKKYGLTEKIILAGHVSTPFPYFKNARLCVVSSIQEGFPNVLLQMIALNTAVVTTLCAGGIENIPLIVKTKVNSVQALSDGMQQGLTTDFGNNRIDLDAFLKRSSPTAFVSRINSELEK